MSTRQYKNDFASHIEGLDESIYNAIGVGQMDVLDKPNDISFGADGTATPPPTTGTTGGGSGSYVNSDTIQASLQTTAAIAAAIKSNQSSGKKELKNECGRRPLLRKKRANWQKCVDNYNAQKAAEIAAIASQNQRSMTAPITSTENTPYTPTDDKILGIPKTGFYIGLGVIALVGGLLLYKKFKG